VSEATPQTKILRIRGKPTERQKLFFASHARYTAYGGARGGGKSWALRRKLAALCLHYPGIHCLLVRRSYAELKANHVRPILEEYEGLVQYRESEKLLSFPNGSTIALGYCASNRDLLRYQGQEYDIIAIDEATQLSEHQFSVFKACLRGTCAFPRRMYLTCNPGGIGHAWVKRIFVDRVFRADENPEDYLFIPAVIYDNPTLLSADPDYVRQLESLPQKLRDAWLHGKWDAFEGQFFPEFQEEVHVCKPDRIPADLRKFAALDYGFDMLAALLLGVDRDGHLYVLRECCRPGLTLREAAQAVSELCRGEGAEYVTASPDLWNRRQDTGKSGFEIMQATPGMPPMSAADNRRVPGWRILREYLNASHAPPKLLISSACKNLISSIPALLCDTDRPEDASSEPHAVTHSPEALRYAVMSRFASFCDKDLPDRNFRFPKKSGISHPLF
jgi:phage terminase large subunit